MLLLKKVNFGQRFRPTWNWTQNQNLMLIFRIIMNPKISTMFNFGSVGPHCRLIGKQGPKLKHKTHGYNWHIEEPSEFTFLWNLTNSSFRRFYLNVDLFENWAKNRENKCTAINTCWSGINLCWLYFILLMSKFIFCDAFQSVHHC